jgi:hypothetical protein
MQDRELVAAIVAGEPDGLGGAYDRYGAPLYEYCRSMLPEPHTPAEAASAVAETFIVATAKLQGLSDPGQLGSWLHAVARNECLRRLGAAGSPGPAPGKLALAPGKLAMAGVGPAIVGPAGLREEVLAACADNTPVGRANRASVAHRAGPFGRTGFPAPVVPAGPRWWREVRRHPRAAAGVAAVAAVVVLAGTAAAAITGGPHRAHASVLALGGDGFGTSSASSGPAGGQSSPDARPASASASAGSPASPADGPTGAASPGTSRSPAPGQSSAPPSRSPSRSPSPPASSSPPPVSSSPPPASSSPPPAPGTLQVAPNKLALSAAAGKAVTGTFIVTAVGGPVNHFTISSANAKVTVSPSSGSLGSAGAWVTVTVTARSTVALRTSLTVDPGKLIVTVLLSIKG